jgi:hypothetical protein
MPTTAPYQIDLATGMSELGQSRTFGAVPSMSELPAIADVTRTSREVRLVPTGDIAAAVDYQTVLLTPQKNGNGPCVTPVRFLRQAK